jgi:ribose 5-phosphate isomerase B
MERGCDPQSRRSSLVVWHRDPLMDTPETATGAPASVLWHVPCLGLMPLDGMRLNWARWQAYNTFEGWKVADKRSMRLALGCDHRGRTLKRLVIDAITERGDDYQDFGTNDAAAVDYPDIARRVAEAVAKGEFRFGILICSSGIGMSIASNKVRGVRAAVCQDVFTASRARRHNDANVLCLGEDVIGPGLAKEILGTFLDAEFEGGRHVARVEKIRALETK